MEILKMRIELRALRQAINELCAAVEKYCETAHSAQETNKKDDAIPKSIPVTVSYSEQVNAGQNRQNTTQEQIAKWTRRAVFAAIFYAGIAALQWCVMKSQLEELHKQTVAQTRPWIGIDNVTLRDERITGPTQTLDRSQLQDGANFAVFVRNYGKSPARVNVQAEAKFGRYSVTWDWKNWGVCKRAEESLEKPFGRTKIVFPEQPEFDIGPTSVSVEGHGIDFNKWIVFCVAYKTPSQPLHHTQFLYLATTNGQATADDDRPNLPYRHIENLELRDTDTDDDTNEQGQGKAN
jgi:hypothetical protein